MTLIEEWILVLKKRKVQEMILEKAIDHVFPWASEYSSKDDPIGDQLNPKQLRKGFEEMVIGICKELSL